MKPTVSKKIKMPVTSLLKKCAQLKRNKKGVTSYLENLGYSKREIAEIKSKIPKTKQKSLHEEQNTKYADEEKFSDDLSWKTSLKFTDKYVYNKADDKYVVYLKAANGNIVIPGSTIRGIIENYSNWYDNAHSINELCRNYKIPKTYFMELKDVFGITHDSEPVSNEELIEKNIDSITEDILQKKKFQLYQKFHRRSWKDTEEAAKKWMDFNEGVLNPFSEFLSKWEPPKYIPVKHQSISGKTKAQPKTMLVGLSDIHFGAKANAKDSFRSKSYSTEEATACLKKYAEDIKKAVEERGYNFNECILTALGDILHTTGAGFTTKGTLLVHDCIKEEQFNAAFDSTVVFIKDLLAIFPKVHVKSVKGNHNDFGDYVLFKTLAAYFRTEKRITFEVFQSDHGLFKVNKCLFIISHGYSAEYKGRLPAPGKARESYITNLFLSHPEALQGVTQKVLLTADQHHLEMREYAEFEHYMLSTSVRGDKHSEAMGLNNIARQSSFIIDNEGIKEIIYSYASK